MAHSLERQWARLVKSYARLKDLYDRALQRERILVDELRDARAEVRDLRSEAKQRDRAARNSMGRLIATARYAIVHLHDAGDLVAAEKLEAWLDGVEDTMQPVVNVMHLIELLDEWVAAMQCDNPDAVSVVWMKTRAVLDAARGIDGLEADD